MALTNSNKLNINKYSFLASFHLNIALLSKHFEDLQNFLSLLKHTFDIIGISEHKITKKLIYLTIHSVLMKPTSHGGTGIFLSNDLTYKLRPDLLINEHGRLGSTAIELIFPNKENICCTIFQHPGMKKRILK